VFRRAGAPLQPDRAMMSLVIGIISGAFGMAYIVYGRRQSRIVPVLAGVLLCVYPWFTDDPLLLGVIGALLLAAPFVTDF
jgi:hypothetical protein